MGTWEIIILLSLFWGIFEISPDKKFKRTGTKEQRKDRHPGCILEILLLCMKFFMVFVCACVRACMCACSKPDDEGRVGLLLRIEAFRNVEKAVLMLCCQWW